MTERQPGGGDPERMARTADKYQSWIIEGITAAHTETREIDLMTARLISQALGRATGRSSALADFGRTGEGDYEALRDEYLTLYSDPTTPPMIREWIDWLGTYLVQREHLGTGRQFMNEHLPPQLERLLVRTELVVAEQSFTVHVPASCPQLDIDQLAITLRQLRLHADEAMQAFLTLPDVNALTDDLPAALSSSYIDTYESFEDAVNNLLEVDEWEKDINDYANERGFTIDGLIPNYEVLTERVRDAYDLVEWRGSVHGFYK